MKIAVFWVVIALMMEAARTSETLVTRLHGATTQKTAIFEKCSFVRIRIFYCYKVTFSGREFEDIRLPFLK
jgi:hypothetical protein